MSNAKRYDPEARQPVLWRGWLLYVLAFPLLPAAAFSLQDGEVVKAVARGTGFALAMTAATLIRKGIRLDNEAIRRNLRRRASTVRYRAVGAGLLSVGVTIVAFFGLAGQHGVVTSILFGLAVLLGCYLYYDFDGTRKDPDIAAIGITTEELVELLDEAEGRIVAIETASRKIDNVEFRDRLRRIADEARQILVTIERDPVDARRARKFLKVYLDGARQVTEGYARSHKGLPAAGSEAPALEDNFRRVLGTIETTIAEQQLKLRENNLTELDVQIEVLQMQLEKEGVT